MKAANLVSVGPDSNACDLFDISNIQDARISIVSINDADGQFLSRILESIGFVDVFPVRPQGGMLPVIRESKPDVIVLSAEFSTARRDFVSAIRADNALAATPILAITDRDEQAISQALLDDIDDVIGVPILTSEFFLRLRNLIQRNSLRRNSERNLTVHRDRLRDRVIDLFDVGNDLLRCLEVT